MNLTDIANTVLVLVFLLGIATMIGLAFRREIGGDGYGHRPQPRSHRAEEGQLRGQVLQRIS
jgi:hypothetical protein